MEIRELQTPCYIIRAGEYEKNIAAFRTAFQNAWGGSTVFGYSVKTNNLPWFLRRAMARGFLAEVVSPDELAFALRCGCPMDRILYNGPQKRGTALDALRGGALVNVDNEAELDLICAAFPGAGDRVRVGLRVNFDLEALCPGETTCEGVPGRFGFCLENGDFGRAVSRLRDAGIALSGLHLHQSSRSRSLRIFEAVARTAAEIGREYRLEALPCVDVGGGFFGGSFFPGKPSFPEYAQTVCAELRRFYDPAQTALVLEPGAAILATAMDYLTEILNVREVRGRRIATADGSLLHINPMMRPHPTPFTLLDGGPACEEEQIIGGSTCMELDRFWPRDLKNLAEPGSRFLFHACGAYMSTHNSNFINAAPAVYLNEDGAFRLLRPKSIDALFAGEKENGLE